MLKITTDKKDLNIEFIHDFISKTYWAKNRTKAEVQTCIDHSLNFGVYVNGEQIGYARVVTDYAVFAYLMDLFISEPHRHKGYSVQLMQKIMSAESLKNIKVWRLATEDAHGLYEKFGFAPIKKPEKMMEKFRS